MFLFKRETSSGPFRTQMRGGEKWRKKYILFDLDGTLTDSADGIINSVIYALKSYGIEADDEMR